jgi:hypothetical protein
MGEARQIVAAQIGEFIASALAARLRVIRITFSHKEGGSVPPCRHRRADLRPVVSDIHPSPRIEAVLSQGGVVDAALGIVLRVLNHSAVREVDPGAKLPRNGGKLRWVKRGRVCEAMKVALPIIPDLVCPKVRTRDTKW